MATDVHILKGWSNIANLENVKSGMNIEEIENQLINGGLVQKTKDPQDKFNDELQDLAKQFGISFGDSSGGSGSNGGGGSSGSSSSNGNVGSSSSNNGLNSSILRSSPQMQQVPTQQYIQTVRLEPEDTYGSVHEDSYEDYDSADSEPISRNESYNNVTPETFSRNDSELDYRTREQERKSHINSVMRDIMPHNSFNFEEEKREDAKCAMLEEIDSLIYSLQDAEVDLSRIPKVDFKSSYEEIEMVLKILRHKSDRTRYCNLAEEFFIWGAYGMEELFDGKRVWFNRYQPCLTGWHTQVQTKLRRMRHDTSQLVSEVMHDYNISPGMRVLLELIPNMFVYSSEKKKNQAQANMYSDDEMAAANERLRQFN
jgi:hypothetical protein